MKASRCRWTGDVKGASTTHNKALKIILEAAERDHRGTGVGMRGTTDAQRKETREAWAIVFRMIWKREPCDSDRFNAGMYGT